ncbi:TPA: hypothetical protein ACF2C8_000795 [Clostridium perfringens]
MTQKEKKITFSEEIDSKITTFAIVLAFLTWGVFLLIYPNYFGSIIATKIIRWTFIIIGGLGLVAELSNDKKSDIKGLNDFLGGIVFIGIWFYAFVFINNLWINIFSFVFFCLGTYSIYEGIIKIVYSSIQNIKKDKESKNGILTDILLFLTKVASLILVILQIVKAFGK